MTLRHRKGLDFVSAEVELRVEWLSIAVVLSVSNKYLAELENCEMVADLVGRSYRVVSRGAPGVDRYSRSSPGSTPTKRPQVTAMNHGRLTFAIAKAADAGK